MIKLQHLSKEHVGTLATLSMAPIVAEEIKATQRGNALAKKLLSPENYKKVVKTNRYGAATYIAAALAVGVGAYVANKVKDAIAKPKRNSLRCIVNSNSKEWYLIPLFLYKAYKKKFHISMELFCLLNFILKVL